MQERLLSILNKNRAILVYLIFGVLTTAVNYVVFFVCYNQLGYLARTSNAIAWIAAVIFAFVTNKAFVFESRSWNFWIVLPELVSFIGTRLASGVAETLVLDRVEAFGWNVNIWKIVVGILVIVVNYVGSKLLVFRK